MVSRDRWIGCIRWRFFVRLHSREGRNREDEDARVRIMRESPSGVVVCVRARASCGGGSRSRDVVGIGGAFARGVGEKGEDGAHGVLANRGAGGIADVVSVLAKDIAEMGEGDGVLRGVDV